MLKAAKLLIINDQNKHFLMYRSSHPIFGDDPDLPGGTWEEGESLIDTVTREVLEETGIVIDRDTLVEHYTGDDYSRKGVDFSLFTIKLSYTPEVKMSWEHSAYEWLDREVFLEKAKGAKDSYMHMVYHVLK